LQKLVKSPADVHRSVYVVESQTWLGIQRASQGILRRVLVRGQRVLDAGCGYGALLQTMPDGLELTYVGVDISPDLLHVAKDNYPQKQLVQADLRALPFRDGEFDWALCRSVDGMIKGDLGYDAWELMQNELLRVAGRLLIFGYQTPDEYRILPHDGI